MKFLIVNTDYPRFLEWLYAAQPGLERRGYEEQLAARHASLFGLADFYSRNLRLLGHEAWDVQLNNEFMQRAWAREHNVRLPPVRLWRWRLRRGLLPWPERRESEDWQHAALAAQARFYRPDVLLLLDLGVLDSFLRDIRGQVRLLVGQHAAMPLAENRDWSSCDLVLSSFPPTVEWLRQRGVRAELFRLGFEETVLRQVRPGPRDLPVTFIGSLAAIHSTRLQLLQRLGRDFPLEVWTPQPPEELPESFRRYRRGSAWGREMFDILGRSRITLNEHGAIPAYANNMRLYEATGMGALLVTDWKPNLPEMFEPGREVVAYHDPPECAEQVRYYLDHPAEREAIAQAGQARTLREHTYACRMRELLDILKRSGLT